MIRSGKTLIKMNVSVTIIMVVGIVWLSLTITPSSAQNNPMAALGLPECWTKIYTCLATAGYTLQDPTEDYAVCCPVIKPQVSSNVTCFCSIKEYAANIPNDQPAVVASQVELNANKVLADCKMDTTYDKLCSATGNAESGNGTPTTSLPGIAKNGAVKIASVGLLPSALAIVWTMIMS